VKKQGILNPDLIQVIAAMGHTDGLAVADSGLPIPPDIPRIDLALIANVPGFLQTVEAVLGELQVEGAVIAEEMRGRSPQIHAALTRLLPGIQIKSVPHDQFKEMLHDVRAVVRTGEQTPYANIILRSGVTF
jgi:D-ribose pyranase